MPDYARTARLLRAKAADKAVTPEERASLIAKATELEAKYRNDNSPFTDDTTITSRDGRRTTSEAEDIWEHFRRYTQAWEQAQDLLKRQHQWNRPPDEADLVERDYKYEPSPENEDYGYEGY